MPNMENARVVHIAQARDRRLARAVDARRRLDGYERRGRRGSGRVWVNGSELGGPRSALAHLAESYD
jgi:hypothetical protein